MALTPLLSYSDLSLCLFPGFRHRELILSNVLKGSMGRKIQNALTLSPVTER